MINRGNPKPHNNRPNTVPKIPDDPDSDPSLSDSSLSKPSDSSDDEYYKQRRREKNDKKKLQSKTRFNDPIKKFAKLIAKLTTPAYKSNVIRFKLDKDPLHRRVYFLSSMK